MRKRLKLLAFGVLFAMTLSGCVTNEEPAVVLSKKSAVELRAIQTRTFETPDHAKVFRAILSVTLDLGYAVTTLEPKSRTITGNKLAQLTLTATISDSNEKSTTVRANAIVKTNPQKVRPPHQVDSGEFYQKRFFEPLSHALFLEALYETEPEAAQNKIAN